MKGILPVYCRTMGYVVLLLSVFVPLFMFMFGMINDSNLLFTKASIKLLIWFSLFMIFLAKVKDENEKISRIRIKAICYAIYLLGIYYIVMLVRGVAPSTFAKPNVDGGLIGGASLAVDKFMPIIEAF